MSRNIPLLTSAAVEMSLNTLILQSPGGADALRHLQGKVLCIQLTQLSWPVYLLFAKQVQVFSHYEGEVNTQVNADLTTLYQLSEGANLTELIKQDKLSLEGDLSVLQSFSHYLQTVEFDFAEPLSRYIGDAPTHMVSKGLKQAKQNISQVLQKSHSHIGQLTTEEYRLAPHKLEYIHLSDSIETISLDVDALGVRIAQLINRVEAK